MPQHDPVLLKLLDKLESAVFEQRSSVVRGSDPRTAGYLALDTLVRIMQIHQADRAQFGVWLPAEVEARILIAWRRAEITAADGQHDAVTVRP